MIFINANFMQSAVYLCRQCSYTMSLLWMHLKLKPADVAVCLSGFWWGGMMSLALGYDAFGYFL